MPPESIGLQPNNTVLDLALAGSSEATHEACRRGLGPELVSTLRAQLRALDAMRSLGVVERGSVLTVTIPDMGDLLGGQRVEAVKKRCDDLKALIVEKAGHDEFVIAVVQEGWHLDLSSGRDGEPIDVIGEVGAPLPEAPEGYVCCRVSTGNWTMTSHLVTLVDGRNDGRPTLCGLTRFDTVDKEHRVVRPADLPGWELGGGHHGPQVRQVR